MTNIILNVAKTYARRGVAIVAAGALYDGLKKMKHKEGKHYQ